MRTVMLSTGTQQTPQPAPSPAGSDPRRQVERHRTEEVACPVGEVADLSRAGMRLVCNGKPPLAPGQRAQVRLTFPRGAIVVTVQARWIKRSGRIFARYEMGFRFLDLTPAAEKAIDSLAKFGFVSKASPRPAPKPSSNKGGAPTPESEKREPRAVAQATAHLPDYYAALAIAPGASLGDIHAAYRRMARQHHPDLCREPDAEEKFMRLREAYSVLRDAEKRASYDGGRAA